MNPQLPQGWTASWSPDADTITIGMVALPAAAFSVERLRIGPVLLDLELRRHHSSVIVRLLHRQGPSSMMCLRFPPPGPGLAEVDGVTLRGSDVRFPFSGQHEVVAYY